MDLAKFNPTYKINFDISGTPPPQLIPDAKPIDTGGKALAIKVENAANEA